jgi:hypothetical protein
VIVLIGYNKISITHIGQFGDCVAFNTDVVDPQLLLNLFDALGNIVCLIEKGQRRRKESSLKSESEKRIC